MDKSLHKVSTVLSSLLISFFVSYTSVFALDVTLLWDFVSHPDLAGYRIYYNAGSGTPPYTGMGASNGPSPIDVPVENLGDINAPRAIVSGLADDIDWYFAVTAYTVAPSFLESNYSNVVNTKDLGPPSAPFLFIKLKISDFHDIVFSGLPVDLFSEGHASQLNVTMLVAQIPPTTTSIDLVLTVFDPDFTNEGRLFLNGVEVSSLFVDGSDAYDAIAVDLTPIRLPIEYLRAGENTLTFTHENTQGYRIEDIKVVMIH